MDKDLGKTKLSRLLRNDFLDQLEHAVEIMGIDKVGIGADFPDTSPKVLQGKVRDGVCPEAGADVDDEIKGILGGNFLRILKESIG